MPCARQGDKKSIHLLNSQLLRDEVNKLQVSSFIDNIHGLPVFIGFTFLWYNSPYAHHHIKSADCHMFVVTCFQSHGTKVEHYIISVTYLELTIT